MRTARSMRAWWVPVVTVAVAAGVPSTAAAQFTVDIAVPAGTSTYGRVIPSAVNLPAPPLEARNPLGLTPGFYSIDLGQCFGSGPACRGAFLTHAAPALSTAGVISPAPLTPGQDLFGPVSGGSSGSEAPAVSATTMPGWSLFAMNFDVGQQAFSVADFTSTIEMPLRQVFPNGNQLLPDWRNHSFSRSADYQSLKVAFPFLAKDAPSRRPQSLELRADASGRLSYETTFFTASSLFWATGFGTVTAADLDFGFGDPPPSMIQAERAVRLLESIRGHLRTEEPDNARQTWLGFNPFGTVAHDDWRRIAYDLEQELPGLWAGRESRILNDDGTFTLPVRADIDAFLLPEPTSVPEPSTVALLALGMTAIGLSRRRRRAQLGH